MKNKAKKLISIALAVALVMTSVLIPEMHSQAAKGGIDYTCFDRGTYGDAETINYLYYKGEKNSDKSFLILDGQGEMPDIPISDDKLMSAPGKVFYDTQGWFGASLDPSMTEEKLAAYTDKQWEGAPGGTEINEIIVGGEIPNIGACTFLYLMNLQTVRLGKSVNSISKNVFYFSMNIKKMYIYGEIESIDESAFSFVSSCEFYVVSDKTKNALKTAGIQESKIHLDTTLMDDTPLRIALKKGAYEQKEHPDGEGYTIGSWKELTSKMEKGQELLDAIDEGTAETTETEINSKAAAIDTAISGLLSSTVLNAAIAKAENLSADIYTADSWAVLQEAVGAGKGGLNTAKTQDDIDELVSAIEEAIEGLEIYVAPTPTAEPTPGSTATPTAEPTPGSTAKPTAEPTAKPTAEPTAKPTAEPTAKPTAEPTAKPTAEPTAKPTAEPTAKPTAAPPKKGAQLTSGNFVYKVTKVATAKTSGTLTVTTLSKAGKKAGKLSVLATATIDGYTYKVTKLGNNALKDAAAKSVTLGKNITAIPKGAFSGCKKLRTLTVNAALKSVKKGAFKGCKNKIKVKGGNKKTRKGNIAKLKKSGYKKFK